MYLRTTYRTFEGLNGGWRRLIWLPLHNPHIQSPPPPLLHTHMHTYVVFPAKFRAVYCPFCLLLTPSFYLFFWGEEGGGEARG